MPDFEEWLATQRWLREKPSGELWELEINRLLMGKRTHLVDATESASEYIENLILSARDPAASKTFFRQALYRITETWEPSLANHLIHAHMFNLIAVYTPHGGVAKLLDFLTYSADFGRNRQPSPRCPRDLVMEALNALQGYFPQQPDVPDLRSFVLYKEVLAQALKDPRYRGHALARLIALRVYEISSDDVRSVIAESPEVIGSLVSYWLSTRDDFAAESSLSRIYEQCLHLDAQSESSTYEDVFREKLGENGALFAFGPDLDPVVTHLRRTLTLPLTSWSNRALQQFKRRYLSYPKIRAEDVGAAVVKMLSLSLTLPDAKDVRTAIAANPAGVLSSLIGWALGEPGTERGKLFSVLFNHCLALDSKKGGLEVVLVFEACLRTRRMRLIYSPFDSSGIYLTIGQRQVPLSYDPEFDHIAWSLLESAGNALAKEMALAGS